MSSTALDRLQAPPPARVGQATMVEQSRAVAEVHAQVVVAQQLPRNIDRAVREMQRSCSHPAVAEKAFYRFPRGGQQVTGESIVLAKELARCWGNIDYGLAELRRDDAAGESEMMAFAWDLETNTRPRTTFIVPHVRDNGSRLTAPRDIYENNANMGVRRMREQILNLMPPWFIEDAKALCYATMAADKRDGETLADRAATAVKRYAGIGVTASQLTQKLGAPQAAWSAADLAQLGVIYKSIERGETTKEDEFGATSGTITPGDLAPPKSPSPAAPETPVPSGPAATPTPTAEVAAAGEAPGPGPAPGDPAWQRALKAAQAQFKRFTGDDQAARLGYARRLLRVSEVLSFNDLTLEELRQIGEVLSGLRDRAALDALLDTGEAPRGEDGQAGDE